MTSVKIYPITGGRASTPSPLPPVIQTPSGLALLELQGTINMPRSAVVDDGMAVGSMEIGKIYFPDYHPDDTLLEGSTAWMKRVYMYVGQHQRLTGEVKKLPKALAIVRKRTEATDGGQEELEVVEIVKYKLVFSQRPEPVGTT
jgi:chromosome transmission fidelity protein 8